MIFPAASEVPMPRRFACLPLLAVLCVAPARADDGLLQKVRDEVRRPSDPEDAGKKDKDDGWDPDEEPWGDIMKALVLAPSLVPPAALHDDYEVSGLFPRYPYSAGRPGCLWLDRPAGEDVPPNPAPRGVRGWSARFEA